MSKIRRFLLSLSSPGFCDYFYVCVCMHVCAKSLQSVRLFATVWTVAHLAPLPVGFSRQEYWSGWPCPPPGHLPNPGKHIHNNLSFNSRIDQDLPGCPVVKTLDSQFEKHRFNPWPGNSQFERHRFNPWPRSHMSRCMAATKNANNKNEQQQKKNPQF